MGRRPSFSSLPGWLLACCVQDLIETLFGVSERSLRRLGEAAVYLKSGEKVWCEISAMSDVETSS